MKVKEESEKVGLKLNIQKLRLLRICLQFDPGEGNGYSLQYSCLENSIDRRSLAGYSPWHQPDPGRCRAEEKERRK